ncbi:MAG: hypothetical protein M1830_009203 [Pleopsidium flavum]|nr:MAG: hypothetical protein M1830_009203 [Pleopsidium flavum]
MERAPRCELLTRGLTLSSWPTCDDSAFLEELTLSVELLDVTSSTPAPYGAPPPSYHDAVADAPPDYTTTDSLAEASNDQRRSSPPCTGARCPERTTSSLLKGPMTPPVVDFGDTSTFKTHGGAKKKKQAQKKADQAKWANSDDEEGNKEGGEGEENGGGAGGSSNGDGGAGGGDDDDWWDSGKKTKGKKGKGGIDEEEEKRKKEEEEKKKKEEDEQQKQEEDDAANGGNALSWADSVGDANPDDEWAGFAATTKKGKKNNKKGKAADPIPPPPPPPPPAPSAPTTSAVAPSIAAFDDINLEDGAPKLDLDFGSAATKDTGSNFGFGGWGNSWNTGSKWDFSGADAAASVPPKDAKDSKGALADNNPWSSGNKKKDKKSNVSQGVDFGDLSALDETQEEQSKANGSRRGGEDDVGAFTSIGKKDKKIGKKAVPEDHAQEEDPGVTLVPDAEPTDGNTWGAWGTASTKKDKKKGKKGAFDEPAIEEQPAVVVVPEIEPVGDDSWGGWGTKKDKKKGKKGIAEAEYPKEQDPLPPPPPPEPVATMDDEWGSFGTKNKKKGKKGAFDEISKFEEPAVVIVPEHEPEPEPAAVDTWGSFGSKKDKKKGKKGPTDDMLKVDDPAVVVVPEPPPEPTAADDTWTSFGTKKDKKKGKKGAVEEINKIEDLPVVALQGPEAAVAADDMWSSFGTKKDKKKGKIGAVDEIFKVEEPPNFVVPESVAPAVEDEWGSFGLKKDKKKGKKSAFEDPMDLEDAAIVDIQESEPAVDNTLGGWGTATKNDKKSKKKGITEVEENSITVVDPAPVVEAVSTVADDDWMNWGTGKKKEKKGKKGAVTETKADEFLPPPPLPPPIVPDILEDSKGEDWGAFGASKNSKDKKGKKGKVMEAAPVIVPVHEPVTKVADESRSEAVDDSWGGWGLSGKDKKKKDKEKEKDIVQHAPFEVVDDTATMSGFLPDSIVDLDAPAEEDTWSPWGNPSKKDKKKIGRKDKVLEAPPPAPTPPAQGLTPEPTSPPFPAFDEPGDDEWGSFAPAKSKAKKDAKKDPLPHTTSSSKVTKIEDGKSSKKGAKEHGNDLIDVLGGAEKDKSISEAKNDSPKEDSPAKAVKGFWGSFGSTNTTSKAKNTKEKDKAKEKEDEKAKVKLEEEAKIEPIIEVMNDLGKKGSKAKTDGKASKVGGKGGEKSSKDDVDALIDLMEPFPEDEIDELLKTSESKDKKDDKKEDLWSFWGSSKKTTGKKSDEPKKEITKQAPTNQKSSLAKFPKEPEPTVADEASPPPANVTAMNKSAPTKSKVAGKSSVAEKIKALEKEKEKKPEPIPPPPAPEPEPPSKAATPPKKSDTVAKAKTVAASKSAASKKKDLSPGPAEEKKSKASVPGSFPSEGADDDIVGVIDLGPAAKKTNKKVKKIAEDPKMKSMAVDVPTPSAPPALPTPPTPPPEHVATKSGKKERARVVRGEGASSWGFWGAAPKKEIKKAKGLQDDAELASAPAKEKVSPPGLTRSKSTKTGNGKEAAKSSSKSSESDKPPKSESRPSKPRGMSFSQLLMGGPSPARTKSTRPKSSSRRQSMDVDAVGLMSPPPEDRPEVSAKAAKLMGMGPGKINRKPSTKGKQKASAVPDPYALDEDDIVMVDGEDEAVVNAPPPFKTSSSKKKAVEGKSKREVGPAPMDEITLPPVAPTVLPERPGSKWDHFEPRKANGKSKSKQFKGVADATDDIVMVEAGPSNGSPEIITGSDELAFVEEPRQPAPLKRSMSSAKKQDKLMGLFGSFRKSRRASEAFEPPKSKAFSGDDDAKRLRRDDRKVRRSAKNEIEAEGVYADVLANDGAFTEPDEVEARKEERRSKRASRDIATKQAKEAEIRAAEDRRAARRETEKAAEEARRAKAREAREKRAREEEEDEARRQEEKRARRAAREERHAGGVSAPKDTGIRDGERRRRHRDREVSNGGPVPLVEQRSPRPRKSERRRSHTDKPVPVQSPGEEADRHVRREQRRAHGTPREKPSRRKSAPPVDDYFDPRNGSREVPVDEFGADAPIYSAPVPLPAQADPYMNGANDHTSSWVNSQIIEPPPPPPVEPTVIELPPTGSGRNHEDSTVEEDARREMRRARRHSKYASITPDDVEGRRHRRDSRRAEKEGLRSSEGSEGDKYARRKSDYAGYMNGGPVKTFDGKMASAGAAKRGSWFKKITNL